MPVTLYPTDHRLPLPKVEENSLQKIMKERRSPTSRIFGSITLEELSSILFSAHGIVEDVHRRTIPSAGGTHPLEIYVLIWDVDGLENGIYHHNVLDNTLVRMGDVPPIDEILTTLNHFKDSAVMLVYSLILPRTTAKYGERGYRFAILEAGHSVQNVHLQATLLGLQSCEIGSFFDDVICRLIGADGVDHVIGTVNVIARSKE